MNLTKGFSVFHVQPNGQLVIAPYVGKTHMTMEEAESALQTAAGCLASRGMTVIMVILPSYFTPRS